MQNTYSATISMSLFWVSVQLHPSAQANLSWWGQWRQGYSESLLGRQNRVLNEKTGTVWSQHWPFLQGQFCVYLETCSLQIPRNFREQWLGSEMASLELKNNIILELTFVFREILFRISTASFILLREVQRLPLFTSHCLVKTDIQNLHLQMRKQSLWSEITKTHKKVLNLSHPHICS